jgi:hypothetical protein
MALSTYATKIHKYLAIWGKTAKSYLALKPWLARKERFTDAAAELYLVQPSSFAASAVTSSGMTLTWTAVTAAAGTVTYTVIRSTSSSFTSPTTVYTGALLTTAVTGLSASTTYHFRITAASSDTRIESITRTVSQATTA